MNFIELANKAKINYGEKNQRNRLNALNNIQIFLKNNIKKIIEENNKDITLAKENNLSIAIIDRLILNESRINSMIQVIQDIIDFKEVIGRVDQNYKREDGLNIFTKRVPLGVIGMIFESRPNVVVEAATLAIKTSNVIILKGGKEAYYSNKILGEIIQEAIKEELDENSVIVLNSKDRSLVHEMLKANQYINCIIPRGSHALIQFVKENTQIPVIAHDRGLCHLYADETLDESKAIKVILNAKTSRTGVCNALETLVLHKKLIDNFLPSLLNEFAQKNTLIKLDSKIFDQFKDSYPNIALADKEDWDTEYLDNILSIKIVNDISEAIEFINNHSSLHTEAILSNNQQNIELFENKVDASCITINASTRFNDGNELGLGAELGISTSKLHVYGPMGVEHLTIQRHVVIGDGHIR